MELNGNCVGEDPVLVGTVMADERRSWQVCSGAAGREERISQPTTMEGWRSMPAGGLNAAMCAAAYQNQQGKEREMPHKAIGKLRTIILGQTQAFDRKSVHAQVPEELRDGQLRLVVANLLSRMADKGLITPIGSGRYVVPKQQAPTQPDDAPKAARKDGAPPDLRARIEEDLEKIDDQIDWAEDELVRLRTRRDDLLWLLNLMP